MAVARKGLGPQRGVFKAVETRACLNFDARKTRGDRKNPVEDTGEHKTKF